jgi:hypothetical protein
MITKEQFEELGLTVMPEFNGYDNKFYRNLAYMTYMDSKFIEVMLGYKHQEYQSLEEAAEYYNNRIRKYKVEPTDDRLANEVNEKFNDNFNISYNEPNVKIEDFDLAMYAKERGWDIMYSTVNGYLVVYCLRSLKFQGYIKTIEDFKQLISWLRIDKFIR